MKTIYLLRHARAEVRDEKIVDKERKLVKSGIEDAKMIAKNMREEGTVPELILSSDAARALETAALIAKKLKFEGPEIVTNEKIYSAENAESLFEIIKSLDETYGSVLLVGHDPSLSALAQLLVKSFTFNLPKAGLLAIESKKRKWAELTPETNQIKLFNAPMKKKKAEKLENQLIEIEGKKLETLIVDSLHNSKAIEVDRVQKSIKKRSRQIAAELINARMNLSLKTMDEIVLFFDQHEPETMDEASK